MSLNCIFFAIFLFFLIESYDFFRIKYKDDPEIFMNVTQMINFYGYPCETHEVVTEDGYILSLQRIPYGRKNEKIQKPVVFLQHGLIDSSFTWVNNPPNQSLGFILADLGYDVWLGNSRGNVYSNKHKTLSPYSRKFWDFSWDEMVKYDLSPTIDYILNLTKVKKLSYIGHSQGTEIAFAKLSENSNFNSKISSFVALAPVAYLGHIESVIKYFAKLAGGLDLIFEIFGDGEFLPNNEIIDLLAKYVCGNYEIDLVCSNLLFLITGFDSSNMNYSRLPIYLSHTPAGTSVKNMVHYAQSYESNKFQMYDYGTIGNLFHYHQISPPKYKLNTYGVPVALFYGDRDWLADSKDVARMITELGNNIKYSLRIPYYNHLDFVWGENAAKIVYEKLVMFIKKYQ